ncbi:MAG TPA: extracellular solute-binding protein [Chthoniobacterales bacterium]|jgi:putative spermidine/putrescine transport system substrate-binding protein
MNRITALRLFAIGLAAPFLCSLGKAADKVVIQYDCIPNYANWGGVTAEYTRETGVRIPPDMKGSSAAMAALEAEKANPQADCAYYSAAIGYQASEKGLHQSYKPKGWEKIPSSLKDPGGLWWTVHTAYIGLIVNKSALKGKPVPQSFADLLKPDYKGMVVYDDPTILGTGFTYVYGINAILKGGPDMNAGFAYLKKLDANILNYAKDTVYNDVLRGEIPIWINADGNGLKMKYVDKGDIEVVIPREGTIAMPLVMAMVKNDPHPDATKPYLDWLLSDTAQKIMAESFFRPVMHVQLSAALQKEFLPESAYAKAVVLPLAEMAANADAVKERWTNEIKH